MDDFPKYAALCNFTDTADCFNITVVDEPSETDEDEEYAGGDYDDGEYPDDDDYEYEGDIFREIEQMIEKEDSVFSSSSTTYPTTSSTEGSIQNFQDNNAKPVSEIQESNQQLVTGEEAERKQVRRKMSIFIMLFRLKEPYALTFQFSLITNCVHGINEHSITTGFAFENYTYKAILLT